MKLGGIPYLREQNGGTKWQRFTDPVHRVQNVTGSSTGFNELFFSRSTRVMVKGDKAEGAVTGSSREDIAVGKLAL